MKLKLLLGISLALVLFASCKKEKPVVKLPVVAEKIEPLEILEDSISYMIEGILYVQKRQEGMSSSIMNAQSNVKLDSLVNRKEYVSGDKDSVMYGRGFKFSDAKWNGIEIMFIKKYNKNQAQPATNQTSFFIPSDKLDLFSIGERKFAMDFTRNNSQNGITIELTGKHYGFRTYGYNSLAYHNLLSPELQRESKFEITNVDKLKSGKYIIEAKFNASVYHGDGSNIRKMENGYLRVTINPANIYF